jgi:carbon monoxide dehydrogenase subunit G
MQFSGVMQLAQSVAFVWSRLSDARFLVDSLKKVEAITLREENCAEWKLRPALAFVAGSLDSRLDITERQAPDRLHVVLTSKGIGSSSTVEVELRLTATADGGTHVNWHAEIKALTGLLKMVPKGLIQSAAQKSIEDVWLGVAEKLAAEPV